MYSFDRYQRWIDQNRDWVTKREMVEQAVADSTWVGGVPGTNQQKHKPLQKTEIVQPRHSRPSEMKEENSIETRIEISDVDEDLETLAKQISGED